MNTKIVIAATVAALSLATTAFAGEGNGDPFPFRAPASSFSASSPARDTGSAQYQGYTLAQPSATFSNATLPENGQDGPVQTANSLPAGFANGTAAYMTAQSTDRWFAQQAEHRFAQAHTASRPRG